MLHKALEIIHQQTAHMSLLDHILYACALLSPFSGLLTTWILQLLIETPWQRWLLFWLVPLLWIVSFGLFLLQLPGKQFMLLIASFLIALITTLIYYLGLLLMSLNKAAQISLVVFRSILHR